MTSEDASNRRPLQTRSNAVVKRLAANLAARRITANQISVAGVGVAVIGATVLVAAGGGWFSTPAAYFIAAGCVQVRLLCNLLDGIVAVEGGLKGKAGELFNEFPDRVEDTLFLAAAGHACGAPALGWACAALAAITAYIRTLGVSLGQRQDFSGPCAKPHRMALLTLGLLAAAVCELFQTTDAAISSALWIIAAGTIATIARRVVRLYRRLP